MQTNIAIAQHLLQVDEPELAYQYALQAQRVAPKDAIVAQLLKQARDESDIARDKLRYEENETVFIESERPFSAQDHSYTVKELLERSQRAAEEKDWFNAHYWAVLAQEACSGTNTNLPQAMEAANYAWSQLKNPDLGVDYEPSFYTKKRDAYIALNQKDYLKAYYSFLRLDSSLERSNDPDINRFLALAKEAVESQYFFIDETENMNQLINHSDVYFSLNNADGTRSVFYIRASMDVHEAGSLIRYLNDFTVVHFAKTGELLYSMYAPIAKVISVSTDTFDEQTKIALGIKKSWKSIPFIMLQAVDRETEGIISVPVYSYETTGLPQTIQTEAQMQETISKLGANAINRIAQNKSKINNQEAKILFLPMPYSDFLTIHSAAGGAEAMPFLTLNNFLKNATNYGFSYEVYLKNLVSRGAYPLFVLIMLLFAATIGWNYRIEDKQMPFKFRWILLLPLYSCFVYAILKMARYTYETINYVLIGTFSANALLAAFIVYAVILAILSLNFMSRKE